MDLTLFLVLHEIDGAERVHKTNNEREAAELARSLHGAIYVLAPSAISAISAIAMAMCGGAIAPDEKSE